MGLVYYDSSTGSNVLFAELQDSTGQLVASNQVVYPNAFTDCDADVRYTYTRSAFEQDIVVQQQLPTPDTFGLNPDTTWLQVWTEFTDPPTPIIEPILDGTDERLDFGVMKMERGQAFIMGSQSNAVPVDKRWTTVQGRMRFPGALNKCNLMRCHLHPIAKACFWLIPSFFRGGANNAGKSTNSLSRVPRRLPPRPTLAKRADEKLKLATKSAPLRGLVLDYTTVNSSVSNLHLSGRHHLLRQRELSPHAAQPPSKAGQWSNVHA